MAQSVKCLQHKHGHLSLDPQYHVMYSVHGRKQRQEGDLERGEKKEMKKRGMEGRREIDLKNIKEKIQNKALNRLTIAIPLFSEGIWDIILSDSNNHC